MRFLSFVKDNHERHNDPDFQAFSKWFLASLIAKKNPHAGMPQIFLFIANHQLSSEVRKGFVKWCVAYFHEPKNMLPIQFKNDLPKLIEFVTL